MKKISLYLSLLASMFVISSCTEDYNKDVAEPQAWDQEAVFEMSDYSLTAASDINLDTK